MEAGTDRDSTDDRDCVLACVEVGGSGVQTVVFSPRSRARGDAVVVGALAVGASHEPDVAVHEGAMLPPGARLAMAVPGRIECGRVVFASSLGWRDVDPAAQLGLDRRAEVVLNDAEAAALGEWSLRDGAVRRLLYVGIGTGIGGAVVHDGRLVADNLLGHGGGFGTRACICGGAGCLETVAAGWALPQPLDADTVERAAEAVARAVREEPLAAEAMVVLTGGLVERHPAFVAAFRRALPGRVVEGSRRPAGAKSAAAWGLHWHLMRSDGDRPGR